MLSILSALTIAQVTSPLSFQDRERQYVIQPQEIRTLPGQLNNVLVFNSNSPEVVQKEGILLSTFPPSGKQFPDAHLNRPLEGRFDIFTHHISRPSERRILYQGLLLHNPTAKTVTLKVLQAASYLTSPDAPFINLPAIVEDPDGRVYSGPGSRLMSDILRGIRHPQFPSYVIIPPYQSRMLFSLSISPSNARSTFMRVQSDGPLYAANLALYEVPVFPPSVENLAELVSSPITRWREPRLAEWKYVLATGRLVTPRDLPPTPLENAQEEKTIYGRVAGISVGSEWVAKLSDRAGKPHLSIPSRGRAFSYPLSTVTTGTHGTRQIQSAPMLVRYSDTAYLAHGNYGVQYNLTLPLINETGDNQTIAVAIQTPFKQNRHSDRLFFVAHTAGQVFFRGTVRVSYSDERGTNQVRYFHLVQHQGQQGQPLVTLNLAPGERREINLDFLYPPDATPPQVLTVQTMELFYGRSQ